MSHSLFPSNLWHLLILGLLVATLLSAAPMSSDDQAGEIPRGAHGEAAMEYQLQELDKVLSTMDVTAAPAGFDPVIWEAFIPEDNEMTAERVALGRKLYFDTRLSKDNTVSCATCHDVTRGFTDQLSTSEGIGSQLGRRNRRMGETNRIGFLYHPISPIPLGCGVMFDRQIDGNRCKCTFAMFGRFTPLPML